MKGIEKGRKKRNRITLRVRLKEKLGKRSASYTLGIRHSFQHNHIAISSGSSEAFRFCAFYILLFISTYIRFLWEITRNLFKRTI